MLSISPDLRLKLKHRLMGEENVKLFPYTDSKGHLSIGMGRNLDTTGISMDEAMIMGDNDIMRSELDLWHYCPWYGNVDDVRKTVLIDMVFNEGIEHLLGFTKMIAAIKEKDFNTAAKEMIDSDWAKEVGKRATNLALIMEMGQI